MITAKVGGRDVPLYMGMKAVCAITQRYGSLAGLREVLSNNNEPTAQNEATFFVAHQLNINASVIEETQPAFKSWELLEAHCRPLEHMPLFVEVCSAIKESSEMTVEADLVNEKNAVATQDTQ